MTEPYSEDTLRYLHSPEAVLTERERRLLATVDALKAWARDEQAKRHHCEDQRTDERARNRALENAGRAMAEALHQYTGDLLPHALDWQGGVEALAAWERATEGETAPCDHRWVTVVEEWVIQETGERVWHPPGYAECDDTRSDAVFCARCGVKATAGGE